mmetsp:Transcript_16128/g.54408  ORF Transcript_16128/g.54408 Transcript_16128/m.54408 type:complete len:241 (-) Transcript_16128:42-764(-)
MQPLHRAHGPPLPVDEQLHRRQQPEALYALPVLHHRRGRLRGRAHPQRVPVGHRVQDVGGVWPGGGAAGGVDCDAALRVHHDVQPDLRHRDGHRDHRPHAEARAQGQLCPRALGRRLWRRPVAHVSAADGRQVPRLPPSHGLQGRDVGDRRPAGEPGAPGRRAAGARAAAARTARTRARGKGHRRRARPARLARPRGGTGGRPSSVLSRTSRPSWRRVGHFQAWRPGFDEAQRRGALACN